MSAGVHVTVQRALTLVARRCAEKVALRYRDSVVTYRDLDMRAESLAHELLSHGLQRGDRVAVMLVNSPDYVVVALACAKAVLCMVPINYRYTSEELARQLDDCTAAALIHGGEFEQVVKQAQLASDILIVCKPINTLGMESNNEAGSYPVMPLPLSATETDLFYLGYTSGTTGRPKGAMVTQRNRALAYHYWALEFGIGPDGVGLHCGPFHHTAPFTFVMTQLFMGGEVVILDAFDAGAAATAIERHGVTWSFMVPFMLERMLEVTETLRGDVAYSSLRQLISGASPLSTRTKKQIMQRFPQVSLHEFYGATEAGVITNLRPADQSRKTRCVGQPVAEIEVEIRNEEGIPQSMGVTGDIWLRGPTLFSGYFNAPEKTAEVQAGTWTTIGDIGYLDQEGFLYLVDRRKDVIKSGGVNIYPIEIEEVILQEPSVRECAVVGLKDERWGEAAHAFVALKEDDECVIERIKKICREHLAGYKQPKAIHCLEALPRNANGKVLKRALREKDWVAGGA